MATSPHIVKADNGYFELWALACGHRVQVITEHDQRDRQLVATLGQYVSQDRANAYTARAREATLAKLAALPCKQCERQS